MWRGGAEMHLLLLLVGVVLAGAGVAMLRYACRSRMSRAPRCSFPAWWRLVGRADHGRARGGRAQAWAASPSGSTSSRCRCRRRPRSSARIRRRAPRAPAPRHRPMARGPRCSDGSDRGGASRRRVRAAAPARLHHPPRRCLLSPHRHRQRRSRAAHARPEPPRRRRHLPPAPPVRPPARPAAAPNGTPANTVYRSGVIDGMAYTLFMDGSIQAELPQGTREIRLGRRTAEISARASS